ncbi:MAG: radical SAM protein [Spirochaetota bacterium]|nr:radical SAM protein [Spirochaetota bacterium]
MKYLFGPVNSRRLGLSLGIDLVPFKTCSLNCIYCECGETTNLTSKIEEYVPVDQVILEIENYLSSNPKLDMITFSGSGEPTLHNGIGHIIDYIKGNFPEYKITVLTNGTLLFIESVRKSILNADIVIPSLDAVSEEMFNKINRPVFGTNPERLVQGLIDFSQQFEGKIILEIFIISELNDDELELKKIRDACLKISPDLIQLNHLDRPGAEDWVESPSEQELKYIKSYLKPLNVEIVGEPSSDISAIIEIKNSEDAVLSTLMRRPSTIQDLSVTLDIRVSELTKIIGNLLASDKIEKERSGRGSFYKLKR